MPAYKEGRAPPLSNFSRREVGVVVACTKCKTKSTLEPQGRQAGVLAPNGARKQGAPRHVACCEVRTYCRFRLRSTPFRSTPVSRMPLACWQPRVSKHSCAGSKNASRSLQTSHVGTARKSRCRSSASMAMAAIEAGDRQEMVAEGLGALLSSLALAADGPFRGRCRPALAAGLHSSR